MKKKGFTLIELLVVISIIAMLLAILMPALGKVKKMAQRLVCGTNLKGLGNAIYVYAFDYEDNAPVQKTAKLWWSGASDTNLTVSSSLYLLVRDADVGAKSFVCPSGDEVTFDGAASPDSTDISDDDFVQMWNFGTDTAAYVSYAYQNPFHSYTASTSGESSKALMADRNPWQDDLTAEAPTSANDYAGRVSRTSVGADDDKFWSKVNNSAAHDRDGQNVVFGDGHTSFEKRADCGTNKDNIYAPWNDSTQKGKRKGMVMPGNAGFDGGIYDQKPDNQQDSVLIGDSNRG